METTLLDTLKAKHRATWASGDYPAVADHLVGDLARTAIEAAGLSPGLAVLDVACGAGNATIPAARAGAEVTGLDLTPELLEEASRRADAAGVVLDLVEGDAERLPFEGGRFDRVLSVVGVQFAPRHEASAQELARVCRFGGRIVLCNWTPEGFIGQFFKTMSPYLPAPPAFASPPPLWGDEAHVRSLFEGTGVSLGFERRTTDFEHDSAASFADFMAESYGPLLKAREALEPQGRWDALRQDIVGLAERFDRAGDGRFSAPSEYLVVTGDRSDPNSTGGAK